jgi:hypothetical protein
MPAPPPPDREELTIKTGGRTLGGWQRVRVTRGVELFPSHFDIELTERFPGQVGQAIVSDTTMSCRIRALTLNAALKIRLSVLAFRNVRRVIEGPYRYQRPPRARCAPHVHSAESRHFPKSDRCTNQKTGRST